LNTDVDNLVSAIQKLIKALGPLIAALLEVVKHLLQAILTDLKNVSADLLNQLAKSGSLATALLQFVGQLQSILNGLVSAGLKL
jgi:hypothetical protein